jgi:hypothetical protein
MRRVDSVHLRHYVLHLCPNSRLGFGKTGCHRIPAGCDSLQDFTFAGNGCSISQWTNLIKECRSVL